MKMTFELSLVTSDTEDTYFKEKNNPVLNNFNYFFFHFSISCRFS